MARTCRTCANQCSPSVRPPAVCPVCEDERQYVPSSGQAWTTQEELRAEGHRTRLSELEPGLLELTVEPRLGIGHRGLLVRTPAGAVLWDPPGYLDDAALTAVRDLGGLLAVTRSHPHLGGAFGEWSLRCPRPDGSPAPVQLPRRDRRWLLRPDLERRGAVRWWEDRQELAPGVTLVRCGGHFAGSAVLHVAGAAGGRGALLVGDTLMVLPGGRRVSFMRSYPMLLPMPERHLDRLLAALSGLRYDRLVGGFPGSGVDRDAQRVVADSARSYRDWLTGRAVDPDQD
ncbi:MBL fold metallo-hydrolase [Kineococcus sp. SYSU DK004]|uniref:hydrolase n=1 Tax=Kineococcus sp. SYSU DK004 TaxID=3383125 RepID=UPI003D7D9A97